MVYSFLLSMEVILVTDKPKYRALVNATKIIQSPNVDIVAIIDTEVFLNHHYDICFYCFRDNFPFQIHMPIKAAKQLLDRNQGPIDLKINKAKSIQITSENDLMEIFPNIQQAMQDPIFDSSTNTSKTSFLFLFWDIQIQFVIINDMEPQQSKLKDAINSPAFNKFMINQTEYKSRKNLNNQLDFSKQNTNAIQNISEFRVNKAVIFINDENYEQFLSWNQGQNGSYSCHSNTKLSKQYLSIKQEVDNEKNSFRNKIKMVETLLGQNINVQKLLNEEKDQNAEFKRLKEIFQTIKNIDQVLIDQQKRIQSLTSQFKQKRALKQQILYSKAKQYTQMGIVLKKLQKSIQQMEEKLSFLEQNRAVFLARRSFEPPAEFNRLLEQYVQNMKDNASMKMNRNNYNPSKSRQDMIEAKKASIHLRKSKFSKQKQQIRKQSTLVVASVQQNNNSHKNLKNSTLNSSNIPSNNSSILSPSPANPNNTSSSNNNPKGPNNKPIAKNAIKPVELIKTMKQSILQQQKNKRQNFREVMLKRSASNFQQSQKKQEQLKNYDKNENIRVQKQIKQLQIALLHMANYYNKNDQLINQIKQRNDRFVGKSQNEKRKKNGTIFFGDKYYVLNQLINREKQNFVDEERPNNDIIYCNVSGSKRKNIKNNLPNSNFSSDSNKVFFEKYDFIKQKDDEQSRYLGGNKNGSSHSIAENTNLFSKKFDRQSRLMEDQIIPKSKGNMKMKEERKCSLLKEEFIEKKNTIHFK